MADDLRKRKREGDHEQSGTSALTTADVDPAESHPHRQRNVRLRKGMVILKGFLSKTEQSELAGNVHRCGGRQPGGFYDCHNEKTKHMRMMNLGLRTDGGKHALAIPQDWKETAVRACSLAAEIDPSIPILRPDICVVNHYNSASRLGWHQDLFSSRDPGLPVVSLSLGQPAVFQYRVSWRKTAEVKSIMLESGDALVFGGRSRGIIHGVPGVGTAFISGKLKTESKRAVIAATGLGQAGSGSVDMPEEGRYNLNFREL